jgi:uncharacterized protein YbbC (DUF1343 family)
MMIRKRALLLLFIGVVFGCHSQGYKIDLSDVDKLRLAVGAARTQAYFPFLKEKKIALCVNHTSTIGEVHLLDTLLSAGMHVVKVFSPEHGFRGDEEAGKHIQTSTDSKTGLPVVSLYGKNKKPSAEQMQGIDVVIFDIQDVGARFYTYISTLHYVMEAAAQNKVDVIVLDRPNPNGFWVDGPVLDTALRSFVGMHPVPVAHGMTIGEYAKMINGEGWLAGGIKCNLTVVSIFGYAHMFRYQLSENPSPNLSSMAAVYLYPSLCLFEGTPMSVGRGTETPFCLLGHPDFPIGEVYFTPKDIPGVATNPPCVNKKCRGFDLTNLSLKVMKNGNFVNVDLLIEAYKNYPDKAAFFTTSFDRLAGTKTLQEQIKAGKTAAEIKESWQEELNRFKQIRKKYLLYPDFE